MILFRMILFRNIFLLLIFYSCTKKSQLFTYLSPKPQENFVYLKNNQFYLGDTIFYPVMLNYVAYIRKVGSEYVISPDKEYDNPIIWEGNTKDSILHTLKGHLTLIKELGFNSIRFVYRTGLNRFQEKQEISIFTANSKEKILLKDNSKIIFDCANQFLSIADSLGLKVMFLLEPPIDNPELEQFTIELLEKFKNHSVIFAYDFFNEPLYFDNENKPSDQKNRDKKDAYRIVKRWHEIMREHAPYHLFTIGFAEPIEVFEWDPSILPVDFVQMHTYHPLRFPNEVAWYCTYVKKPIMIGETSLPADNDSITYEEQRQFMIDAFKFAKDYGCIGFGWWQFQEVQWGSYEHDFTALLNHQGITKTQKNKYIIQGSLKPAAYEVKKLLDYQPQKRKTQKWVNYYNMLGYKNIVLKGKIVEKETGKPIEGALIRGWTEWWDIAANTYTDSLGNFTLYSNKEFIHFQVSALGKENLIFDYKAHYEPIIKNPIPWEKLPNQQIEYHKISYQPFLKKDRKNSEYPTFDFEPNLFNQAQYQGIMKNIELANVILE